MSEILAVTSAICASALICTRVSGFVTDGSTKKIISLVMGAFIICSMIGPVKNAVSGFQTQLDDMKLSQPAVSTDDEAYSKEIVNQTRKRVDNKRETIYNLLQTRDVDLKGE